MYVWEVYCQPWLRMLAVFELPVSNIHFPFRLIRVLEKRRPGETRIQGAVFKQRTQNLYFSNRHELLLVMSVP